ncbi:hypothetical protein FW774_11100 [Pedobacter sp. BS3]|uniref:hypothetical protein n=1 Tax=Pedobacter sp. BS3 TaxID=2567937 RepID=UPI0011F020A8|nr:hypothetical protein [Pedobacter sp. BS3]TZF83986.1 hypothetical protein FW774_11100 [Pedobacter sp. BS3]
MECLTEKDKIAATVNEAKEVSFREKTHALTTDEQINSFLDKILEFKQLLHKKTTEIETFCEKLEALTWFNKIDEDSLKLLNDLIAATRDWHNTLVRQFLKMNKLLEKGIATKDIKSFKHAIDDLRESADDLESVFFHLPQNHDFQETTKELQLV